MIGALLLVSCSEDAPEEAVSSTTTIDPATGGIVCGADDLLMCARDSTIGAVVPDEPVAASGEPLVLGMINQENTPAGSFPELSQANQAAVEFINAELGGIDGVPLRIDVCNTEFSAEGSTACAQQFVDAGVPAVLGGIDVFGNAIDVLRENGIPYIGGIPVSEQSAKSENSFQWSGGSWGASVGFAYHAAEVLEAERVAIVYGEFGSITESAEYAQTTLEARGIEVAMIPYPILSTDVSSALQAAHATDPDGIIFLGADTGCKGGFEGVAAIGITAQMYYVGACVVPTIVNDVDVSATDGAIFNVEGEVRRDHPNVDASLYFGVIETYGDGLDPISAGTVSFRSLMNLLVIMRELGADDITSESITAALKAKVEAPSFMGHPYTCDGEQIDGLPALCSPDQILAEMRDRLLYQVGDWIDVGQYYGGS